MLSGLSATVAFRLRSSLLHEQYPACIIPMARRLPTEVKISHTYQALCTLDQGGPKDDERKHLVETPFFPRVGHHSTSSGRNSMSYHHVQVQNELY